MSSISVKNLRKERKKESKELKKKQKMQSKQLIPPKPCIHFNDEIQLYTYPVIKRDYSDYHYFVSDIFIFMECILKYVTCKEWKEFMASIVRYKKNEIQRLWKENSKKFQKRWGRIFGDCIEDKNLYERLTYKIPVLKFIFNIDKIIYKYAKKLPIRINILTNILLSYSTMINFEYRLFPQCFNNLLRTIQFNSIVRINRMDIPIFIHGASRAPLITYRLPSKPLFEKNITIEQLTQKKINAYKLEMFTKYLENTSDDNMYSKIAIPDIMSKIAEFISGIPNKTYQAQIDLLKKLDYSSV